MSRLDFEPDRVLREGRIDSGLMVSVIMLWGLGIFTLMICSFASSNSAFAREFFPDRYYFFKRQLASSVIGFAGLALFSRFNMGFIRGKLLPFLLAFSLLLCLMTKMPGIGISRNGASRWIRIPFSTFQPSELVKFVLVLFLANYFVKIRRDERWWTSWFPVGVVVLFDVIILVMQSDFSTAALIFGVVMTMFLVCGIEMRHLLKVFVGGVAVGLMYIANTPNRLNRLLAYFSPEEFASGFAYQPIVAKRAISAGGFFGVGVGSGMTRIVIPEIQTDFIFAGWAESMGFVGVLLFFAVALFFFSRACRVAATTPDMFSAYGTFGCAVMIFFQVLLNCGVVCGVFPTTGITLPFFSYGGSSLIITLMMCGFMLNASRGAGAEVEESL